MRTREIKLTKGRIAFVDESDFEMVSAFTWYFHVGYAWCGRNKSLSMHRFLFGTDAKYIDHIDGDGLNNSRSNLRPATASQNAANSKFRKNNKSGRRGIYWNKARNLWHARIRAGKGLRIDLGYFNDINQAAMAYNDAARQYHGEFARSS